MPLSRKSIKEKKATLGIYTMAPPNKIRVMGACSINLANYCYTAENIGNFNNFTQKGNLSVRIQNCTDKNAHLELEVCVTPVKMLENYVTKCKSQERRNLKNNSSYIGDFQKNAKINEKSDILRSKSNLQSPILLKNGHEKHNISCNVIELKQENTMKNEENETKSQFDDLEIFSFKENSRRENNEFQRDKVVMNLSNFLDKRLGNNKTTLKENQKQNFAKSALTTSRFEKNNENLENYEDYKCRTEILINCLKKQIEDTQKSENSFQNQCKNYENNVYFIFFYIKIDFTNKF